MSEYIYSIEEIKALLNDILKNTDVEKKILFGFVHDYDGINLSMIWGFLKLELKELEDQIKSILEV